MALSKTGIGVLADDDRKVQPARPEEGEHVGLVEETDHDVRPAGLDRSSQPGQAPHVVDRGVDGCAGGLNLAETHTLDPGCERVEGRIVLGSESQNGHGAVMRGPKVGHRGQHALGPAAGQGRDHQRDAVGGHLDFGAAPRRAVIRRRKR